MCCLIHQFLCNVLIHFLLWYFGEIVDFHGKTDSRILSSGSIDTVGGCSQIRLKQFLCLIPMLSSWEEKYKKWSSGEVGNNTTF